MRFIMKLIATIILPILLAGCSFAKAVEPPALKSDIPGVSRYLQSQGYEGFFVSGRRDMDCGPDEIGYSVIIKEKSRQVAQSALVCQAEDMFVLHID